MPDKLQRPATLYDVAALAEVSHMTVSRFVQGAGTIHPERRARIERAIAELGYRPNLTARSLATNRSHRMGALVYEMAELRPMRILDGATGRAREAGYLLDIVSPDPSDELAIQDAVTPLTQSGVAGPTGARTNESDSELARCWYSDDNFERLARVRAVAKERGVLPINIALAYVLCQPFPTFPLIGPRSLHELETSLPALAIQLSTDELKWLNLGR